MKLTFVHFRAQLLEYARLPAFAIPILLLPVSLFALIGLPSANGQADATFLMLSFAAFAVFGVAFFQSGVSVALERERAWERFLRVLPISPQQRLAARFLTGIAFGTAALVPALAVALLATDASLTATGWILMPLVLFAGAVPFALLGLCVGYWVSPKAALAVANLIYLPLAYLGSLWTPPEKLPGALQDVSPLTPTRQWAELLEGIATGGIGAAEHWLALAAFTIVFSTLAVVGYTRDEGEKFS